MPGSAADGPAMTLKVNVPVAWFGAGGLVHHATVLCEGGRVTYAGPSAAAPPADELLEVDGFLMRVVDRHVHIRLADPGAVLFGGVTAVRDLGWVPEEIFALANASELPSFTGPVIRAAGPMLTAPGGYPTQRGGPQLERVVSSGPRRGAAVAELADSGAAAVKVALNSEAGPTPSDAELAAIVQAAHERDLPVTAHVQGGDRRSVPSGRGSTSSRTPWTERLPDPLLEAAARTMRMVSTLDILSFGDVTQELRTACDNLVRFRTAGGTVVYGTDLGNGAIPPGIHLREALLLHEAVRMKPEEVLVAMTAGPIAVDGPADLIVLGSDPLVRLEALGDLRTVVRAGRVVSG